MSEKKKYVEWTDELSVGIQEIDEQHKVLIDIINRLFEATISGGGAAGQVEAILDELVQYTIIHFSVEESLFRIFDYPEAQTHHERHVGLKAQVIELQEKIKGGAAVNADLLIFLRKWLQNHIMTEDKTYAPYLLKQGVKSAWGKKSWVGKIWGA